jgi:hypothetical protein
MAMMDLQGPAPTRRRVLGRLGAAGLAMAAGPALAATTVTFPFPGGVGERPVVNDFPGKKDMVLQRTRPPLLCAGTGRSFPRPSTSTVSG